MPERDRHIQATKSITMIFGQGAENGSPHARMMGNAVRQQLLENPTGSVAVVLEDDTVQPTRAERITRVVAAGELSPTEAYATGYPNYRSYARSQPGGFNHITVEGGGGHLPHLQSWQTHNNRPELIADPDIRAQYAHLDGVAADNPGRLLVLPETANHQWRTTTSPLLAARSVDGAIREAARGNFTGKNVEAFTIQVAHLEARTRERDRDMVAKLDQALSSDDVSGGVILAGEGHAWMPLEAAATGYEYVSVILSGQEGDRYQHTPLNAVLLDKKTQPDTQLYGPDFMDGEEAAVTLAKTAVWRVHSGVEKSKREYGVEGAQSEQGVRAKINEVTKDFDAGDVRKYKKEIEKHGPVGAVERLVNGSKPAAALRTSSPIVEQRVSAPEIGDKLTAEQGIPDPSSSTVVEASSPDTKPVEEDITNKYFTEDKESEAVGPAKSTVLFQQYGLEVEREPQPHVQQCPAMEVEE